MLMMAKGSLPPGFRFHPTDVELVLYYLKRKIMGKPFRFEAISEVELYKFSPWDLPEKSCLRSRDLEWYFFCPRDRKYSHGSRTNRATETGYWKTTGKDRTIVHNSQTVGMKKTLIFHLGKPPQGSRTDWVMYEFRLISVGLANVQDSYVVCKIFKKSGPGPKSGEQYGAPFEEEEDWDNDADIEYTGCLFPYHEQQGEAHSVDPSPLQCVASDFSALPLIQCNYEVGEPSSVHNLSEVRELSSVPNLSEVGVPAFLPSISGLNKSFTQGLSEGEDHPYVPEPSNYVQEPSNDDGILIAELAEFLFSTPPHSEDSASGEFCSPANFSVGVSLWPEPDHESIYHDLGDFPGPQSQHDATELLVFTDNVGHQYWLHPALAEFADDHYLALSDFGLVNGPYPLGNEPGNLQSSIENQDNGYLDSGMIDAMETEFQLTGPDFRWDQLPWT